MFYARKQEPVAAVHVLRTLFRKLLTQLKTAAFISSSGLTLRIADWCNPSQQIRVQDLQ